MQTPSLEKDYVATAAALKNLGFNAEQFDLQVSRVSVPKHPESGEAKIQAVVDNKAINKSGSLFKVRVVGLCLKLESDK